MSLKTATTIAIWGILADLILGLLNWAVQVFNLLHFSDMQGTLWIGYAEWLVTLLLSTCPILIFLFILRKKQTGGGNG